MFVPFYRPRPSAGNAYLTLDAPLGMMRMIIGTQTLGGRPEQGGFWMSVVRLFDRDTEDLDFQRDEKTKASSRALRILRSLGLMASMIAVATLISIGFRNMGYSEANYILAYNLGVVLIAYFSDGYFYCIAASFLSMLTYNYFFTVPYFTLIAYSPEYPVTFVSMLISALIASTLTTRVKRESRRAENREKRVQILYRLEKNLLAVNSKPQLLKVAAKDIGVLFGASVMIAAADLDGQLSMRHVAGADIFQGEREKTAMLETFQSGLACGAGGELYAQCEAYYLPVMGPSGTLGVIGIAFPGRLALSESQKLFLNAVTAQIALAMERERLYEKQQRVKLEVERERLRSDLLRSVSHDLRTPLTGILGSIGTLLDHYDALEEPVRRELLTDVYNEADWLSTLVENVLSLTRLENQRVKLTKQPEAVEEIVAAAVSRVKRRSGKHAIAIDIPNELFMVPMDGTLIEQVLVNLLDNAIQHTPEETGIRVSVRRETSQAVFEVADRGPGIPQEALPRLFDRFYTRRTTGTERKGAGLGLSICKAIVEAHGGAISALNNPDGGALFRFALPLEG
jgi:two-component system, OmpR family, sensor histidine kinase KdpD